MGAVRIQAEFGDIKCVFLYPLPDSSLRVRLWSFFCHHSDSARRSRMTAGLNTCLSFLNEVKNLAKDTGVKYVFAIVRSRMTGNKRKYASLKLSPLVGESVSRADERGKCEQKRKNKKISMSKTNKTYSDLYTQTCPYRLARLGTSLRVRGKLTLRKKEIIFFI